MYQVSFEDDMIVNLLVIVVLTIGFPCLGWSTTIGYQGMFLVWASCPDIQCTI